MAMTIPAAQIASLNERYLADFIEDTRAYLALRYPEWMSARSDDELDSFIRTGIRKAGRYNLDAKAEVRAYVEYSVLFGAGFEKAPDYQWAAEILNIRNLHGSEKLHRLQRHHPL